MKKHITGLIIGLAIGALDCALFAVAGESLTTAIVTTALSFWMTIGWAVHMAEVPIPSVFKGVLIAWFFNVSWVIEFVINQGQTDLLIPMLVLATVFGAVIGLTSQYFRRRTYARVSA